MIVKDSISAVLISVILVGGSDLQGADPAGQKKAGKAIKVEAAAGHSHYGKVFDEGPRQAARLMGGMGDIDFPVTSNNPKAKAFFTQGVGQLHGFWNYEAERSFRQAAALDPDCVMAYWGMAMANLENITRFEQFTDEAFKRLKAAIKRENGITEREELYVHSLRSKSGLKRVIRLYPDDIEAKAFRTMQIIRFSNRALPGLANQETKELFREIFAVNPMHPAHHYHIHLWEMARSPQRAMSSAEKCGQSAPGIAHMWHMPGAHVYANIGSFANAVYYQEAATRVDHSHMIRDRVMPDQIALYVHNNEWLTRNLSNIGRVHRAISLAKNMIELPRHPKYNKLKEVDVSKYEGVIKSEGAGLTSANFGRLRLFQLLARWEQWDELIKLSETRYLEPSEVVTEQVEYHRYLGTAFFRSGDVEKGKQQLEILEQILADQIEQRENVPAEAGVAGRVIEKYYARVASTQRAVDRLKGHRLLARGIYLTKRGSKITWLVIALSTCGVLWMVRRRKKLAGLALLAAALLAGGALMLEKSLASLPMQETGLDPAYISRVYLDAGDKAQAERIASGYASRFLYEAQPMANLVYVLWHAGKQDDAAKVFKPLRTVAGLADLDMPAFRRLAPIAEELGFPEDWRTPREVAQFQEGRPDLEILGAFLWHPSPAPEFSLKDAHANVHSLADYRGKPVVVIFHLGADCPDCTEQLTAFSEKTKEFAEAGISLIAISTDGQKELKKSLDLAGDDAIGFPIVSDAKREIFKRYRAYDDFEDMPLHGTFLIDAEGLVRWQDIGSEPFMKPDFVLNEAKRLFQFPVHITR